MVGNRLDSCGDKSGDYKSDSKQMECSHCGKITGGMDWWNAPKSLTDAEKRYLSDRVISFEFGWAGLVKDSSHICLEIHSIL